MKNIYRTLILVGLTLLGCSHSTTEPEQNSELIEQMKVFNKAKSDWETLIYAYASETKTLGTYEYIGFNPGLSSNELWKVYEDSLLYGRLFIKNLKPLLQCPENSVWAEAYNVESKSYVFYNPKIIACNDLIPYIQ